MAMMKKFDKEFIERTINILENCSKHTEYEVTLLLNCLLALVTLPIERNKIKKGNIQSKKITTFQKDSVEKIKELKNEREYINICEEYFFNNIRNSIAHLHIELEESNYKNRIENIILRNAKNDIEFNKKNYDLQINISVQNFKKFALYVAKEYIKRFF